MSWASYEAGLRALAQQSQREAELRTRLEQMLYHAETRGRHLSAENERLQTQLNSCQNNLRVTSEQLNQARQQPPSPSQPSRPFGSLFDPLPSAEFVQEDIAARLRYQRLQYDEKIAQYEQTLGMLTRELAACRGQLLTCQAALDR